MKSQSPAGGLPIKSDGGGGGGQNVKGTKFCQKLCHRVSANSKELYCWLCYFYRQGLHSKITETVCRP